MISVGIMQSTIADGNEYLNGVAFSLSKKGYEVYCFTPDDYDFNSNKVTGLLFNNLTSTWLKKSFPLPNFIYDRCFYPISGKGKRSLLSKVERIKTLTTFIGEGLPNKWAVHQWLMNNNILSKYLPPTQLLTNETINSYLSIFHKLVLKPVNGSGGKGIYFLFNENEKLELKDGQNRVSRYLNKPEDIFNQGLPTINHTKYLIQPYLPLHLERRPFDFRIVLQKQSLERWYVVGKGFRFGKENSFLSNLQAGGIIRPTIKLRKHEKKKILNQIQEIVEHIPGQLEKYHSPLFELGVDLGIDTNHRVWIVEVNSKPGYQTVLDTTDPSNHDHIFHGVGLYIESIEKKNRARSLELNVNSKS
ncbi:YheC/YheD family protein [Evansella tamaricis]|uniref:YheC/YheD family protein n=1 Tax=Evansella tamaricis TaxID=2069301 RepID=A0ABS6JCH7_9BACI|nr:YheC/YheD family protein [Evansella tamaricis]MBU9711281.1 YheC/YheD family protein [Evansella tamaricis]